MNQPKYQIFVSSTYKDLKDERDAVIKSILEIGHIPVGMEMFSAGDEEQWQLIQRTIDDCDYYLVIIGGKYGSMDGDISYTEKEYDYAKSKGIPTLGFVMQYDETIALNRVEKDQVKIQKLEEFKNKVKGRIVNYWKNKDELTARVLAALTKQFIINPRNGWIRGDNQANPHVLEEISRLSMQNEQYRLELEVLKSDGSQGEMTKLIAIVNKLEYNIPFVDHKGSINQVTISYQEAIEIIYLELLNITNLNQLKQQIIKVNTHWRYDGVNEKTFNDEFRKFWTFLNSQNLVRYTGYGDTYSEDMIDFVNFWTWENKFHEFFKLLQLRKTKE